MIHENARARHLIFYDGVCGLCNGFVRWVARNDPEGVFCFAPLQGVTAKAQGILLDTPSDAWSIVLCREDRLDYRSTAVLQILTLLPGWGAAGKMLQVIPVFIREPVYEFVARIRYSVFGKTGTCPLPDPGLRDRLLP